MYVCVLHQWNTHGDPKSVHNSKIHEYKQIDQSVAISLFKVSFFVSKKIIFWIFFGLVFALILVTVGEVT